MKIKVCTMFLVFGLFTVCRSLPTQGPTTKDSSVAIAKIKFKALFADSPAETIYITKANGKGALLSQDEIVTGNWSKKARCYWLNATPGEYIIVAATYEVQQASTPGNTTTTQSGKMTVTTTTGGTSGGKIIHTVFFPKSVVEKSKFKVMPGKLVYVGDFLLDTNKDYEKADDFQKYYSNRIAPGQLQLTGFSKLLSTYHLGTLEKINDNETEKSELMGKIKEDFEETPWMYLFNK